MAKSKIELQEEIKKLNHEHNLELPVTGNYGELQDTLKKAKTDIEKATGSTKDNQTGGASDASTDSKNAVYVWVKNPAYVDQDGKKRVGSGLYLIDIALYPRLAKLPKTACELFEGEVPVRKLVEIAKWFGVNTDKHSDEDLLGILVKEPALY